MTPRAIHDSPPRMTRAHLNAKALGIARQIVVRKSLGEGYIECHNSDEAIALMARIGHYVVILECYDA